MRCIPPNPRRVGYIVPIHELNIHQQYSLLAFIEKEITTSVLKIDKKSVYSYNMEMILAYSHQIFVHTDIFVSSLTHGDKK